MKKLLWVLPVVFLFATASSSQADIIGDYIVADDHDGAITCTGGWTESTQTMNIFGNQYEMGPGHILSEEAGFNASSTGDPTITYNFSMDNETDYNWTSYTITFGVRAKAGTPDLTGLSLSGNVISPGNWSVVSVTPLTKVSTYTYNDTETLANYFIGTVTYAAGTPIPPANSLDVSLTASFKGATSYVSFMELTPVPEPATLVLLAAGGAFTIIVRRRARKA
jgi:hypothetical protein